MSPVSDLYRATDDGALLLSLHVQPGAGRTEVVGRHGGALKVKVAAPPVEGRANEAVVRYVAQVLGIKPAAVSVTAGERSRAKVVRIDGVEPALLEAALEPLLEGGGVIGRGRR